MTKRKKKPPTFKECLFWTRVATGHYKLMGEYVVGEKEIFAEIKRNNKNKWQYCLWTWGSAKPKSLEYFYMKYDKARDVKKKVIELVCGEEPKIR
jgi:hypothetical protein